MAATIEIAKERFLLTSLMLRRLNGQGGSDHDNYHKSIICRRDRVPIGFRSAKLSECRRAQPATGLESNFGTG
jgi:hypothetical protein